jgi:error-prone DNA polymerase
VANLVVFERIAARDRAALVSGRLLIAEGRVEREVEQVEVPITHLIVDRLIDRSDLLSRLTEIGNRIIQDQGWTEKALGRANEARRPEPGSQRPKLPGSRDFH